MDPTVFAAIMGAIGGAARATIGLCKALALKKRVVWRYYALTVIMAALIGAATGSLFSFDPRFALLAGYSGTDLLEGIYKAFKAQKFIVR